MALDYSERRQVSKNRSRRNPVRFVVVLVMGGICLFYGLGVVTGWLIFRPSTKNHIPLPSSSGNNDARHAVLSAPTSSKQPLSSPVAGNNVPLTFYKTLAKGEKGVIGSGLNPAKEDASFRSSNEDHAASHDVHKLQKKDPDTQVNEERVSNSEKMSSGKKTVSENNKTSKENTLKEPMVRKNDAARVSYSVQIASSQDKKEAEELKQKLQRTGFTSRIVETKIPGKGVWFRVRVGSRMDQESAYELATKIGRNAIVVPEQ